MKKAIILTVTAIAIAACTKKENNHENTQQTEQVEAPAETTADTVNNAEEEIVYTCPMHPEVVGNKGEKCPKCEMDLVAKE